MFGKSSVIATWCAATLLWGSLPAMMAADDNPKKVGDAPAAESTAKPADNVEKPKPNAEGLIPLNKQGTVLLDAKKKRLLLKTKVVLREGLLEMFCCIDRTKEHESIVSVDAKAYVVHSGLLAIGAKPGAPVSFMPSYKPPSGQKIDVFVTWKDAKGQTQRVAGQSWVRHALHRFYVATMEKLPDDLTIPKEDDDLSLRYTAKFKELTWYGPMSVRQRDKLLALSKDAEYRKIVQSFFEQTRPREMEADWLFAGSGFFKNEETGEEVYEAEGGDLICVANFPTAMMDVSIRSSDKQEEGILFEPYTERIPPVGTQVTVELIPVAEKPAGKPGEEPAGKNPPKSPAK
ncbi:MAG: YdjY domain-containing protein [Planctomycetaceae bacterium]